MKLFPNLPEDLAAITEDDLRALLDQFKAAARGIKHGTTDLTEFDLSPEEVVEEYRQGVVAIRAIETELAEKAKGVENFAAALAEADEGIDLEATEETAEVSAELAVEAEDEPEPEPEPDPDPDPEVTEVAETAAPSPRLALPAVAKDHRPLVVEMEEATLAFEIAAGVPGITGGKRLSTRRDLANAFIAARNQRTALPEGFEDRMSIASLNYAHLWPEEQRLSGDFDTIMGQIDARFEMPDENGNRVASGGLCAPPTNIYDVVSYGSSARPVRANLPSFNAVRGGINVPGGLSIADIDDGVGIITAANDEAGGSLGTKSCLVITCPAYTPTSIQAVYACIQFGNLNSRAWPELVERFLNELAAQHARVAEREMLDQIALGSKTTTRAASYGATSTIIHGLLQALAAYRLRYRINPDLTFDLYLPDWLPELLMLDQANQQFGQYQNFSRAAVTALLGRSGANVTWYMDTPTGVTTFGNSNVQNDGAALVSWPTTVHGFLHPRGTFIALDSGELNLGLVRDSTLNSTNDYQMFRETFENVAFIGIEGLEIVWTLAPNGVLADVTAGTFVA